MNQKTDTVKPGTSTRPEFDAVEIRVSAETSALALAEREKATIQAMFIVALNRPRDIDRFEQNILRECDRPGFAEVARYERPVGKEFNKITGEWEDKIAEGWSIRFAEAVMRHWTNVFCDAKSAYEDERKRIVRMAVIDLESNITISSELHMAKTVERRGRGRKRDEPPEGREVLGQRINSKGDPVFIVAATDDELNSKQANHWSKFIRNVLRFVPGDVLDKCLERVQSVLDNQAGDEAREKLRTGFDALGISATDLQTYLGHAIKDTTKKELAALRKLYTAIKENEIGWSEAIELKNPTGSVAQAEKKGEERIAEERMKAAAAGGTRTEPVTAEEMDRVAAERKAALGSELTAQPSDVPTQEEMDAATRAAAERENRTDKLVFGRKGK